MVIATFVAFPLKLRDWYIGPSGFQLDEIAYGLLFGFLIGVVQWIVMYGWVQDAAWWVYVTVEIAFHRSHTIAHVSFELG